MESFFLMQINGVKKKKKWSLFFLKKEKQVLKKQIIKKQIIKKQIIKKQVLCFLKTAS